MKVIRKSIFETNSSSMHSITVQNVKNPQTEFENISKDAKGHTLLTVALDDYGWGPMLLTSPDEKLSYIMSTVCNWMELKEVKQVFNFMNDKEYSYVNEYFVNALNELKEAIRKKYPGLVFKLDPHNRLGSIDHESMDTLDDYMYAHKLSEIVFNPKIIIVVEGDSGYYTNYNSETDEYSYDFHGELELNDSKESNAESGSPMDKFIKITGKNLGDSITWRSDTDVTDIHNSIITDFGTESVTFGCTKIKYKDLCNYDWLSDVGTWRSFIK